MTEGVYIIIVNYNGYEDTIECIKSISRYCPYAKAVIIDNCSTDQSMEVLERYREYYDCLIRSEDNNGFAAANNMGIKYALSHDAKWVMLLNNDTVLLNDVVSSLLGNTKDKEVSSPLIYNKNRDIWFAGGGINYDKGFTYHYTEIGNDAVCFLSGCCMFLSAAALREAGLMPDEYFMYFEDVDYSIQLKRAGYTLKCVPEAEILHKVGSSSGKESGEFYIYYSTRNRLYFLKKNGFKKRAYYYSLLTRYIKYMFSFFRKSNDRVILEAIMDFKKNRMGKKWDRR